MTARELTIVANERHVERLALAGHLAETRASLRKRLLARLLPDVRLATPEETRLLLAEALRPLAADDPLLAPVARSSHGGGAAWLGVTDALDDAVGALRVAGTPPATLERLARSPGALGARAATLRRAMGALDRALDAVGLVDDRSAGARLAEALRGASPPAVIDAVGALHLRARHVLVWDASDLLWWRALDDALRGAGGSATLELFAFEQPLDAERDRDPLEVLLDDVARRLDEAPETTPLRPRLGDLRLDQAPQSLEGVEIRAAADAGAQASAVVDAVAHEIARGVPVESIAVALPRIDEEVLVPLRIAFDEAKLPFHDTRGPAATAAPIVAFALRAHRLASRGLPRREVAALLRSRYLDARALTDIDDPAEARAALLDASRALDATPTIAAADPASSLEDTVRADARPGADARARLVRHVADLLGAVEKATRRGAHVRAARDLWRALGLPGRAGFDARRTLATDEIPDDLARAELHALARDAHAWDVLTAALDAYEVAIDRTRLAKRAATPEIFRHELERALEAGAPPPGAGRVGAVRIGRLAELAGDPLACVVVVDANEGVLPSTPPRDPLLSDALLSALYEADPRSAPASTVVRSARELAALGLACSHAERVVLVHRTRGEDGGALAPAPIVAWLARGGVPTSRWVGTLLGAPLTRRTARLRAIAARPDRAAAIAPEAAARAHVEQVREAWHGRTSMTVASEEEAAIVGDVDVGAALAEHLAARTGADERAPMQVTALERFARCPFQGYASHVLGARDQAAQTDAIDAREHGTIVHEALAAAFQETADLWRGRPRDEEAIRARGLEAADAVLRREAAAAPLRRIALDRAREDVTRALEYSLADGTWDFAFAERSFGEGARDAASWPALVLDADGTHVALRGRIDRVDVTHDAPTSARVVDYKTSKSAGLQTSTYRVLGQTALQVPLYAEIAARVLDAAVGEGLYLPLADLERSYAPPKSFAARWRGLFTPATEGEAPPIHVRVADIVARARRGRLAPRPFEPAACTTCRYDGGCRRPRFVVGDESGGGEGEG